MIPWQFPFTMETVELGWYANEDSIYLMGPALGLILLIELGSRLVKVRAPASP